MRETIIKANKSDYKILANMLFDMYTELSPDIATQDRSKYIILAKEHLAQDDVLFDVQKRGFFIMRDESSIVLETKLWNGVSVYIKPQFRKTNILSIFYKYVFKNYDGDIMGFTEANSEHNNVLNKRHKLLGFVYKLNRYQYKRGTK